MKNILKIKNRKNDASIVLMSITIAFALLSTCCTSSFVIADTGSFTPHSLLGYAKYSGTIPAEGATVDAHNDDTNDWIYGADTISSSGQFSFNVGSPGPGWSDDDQVTIYVHQDGTEDYQGWSGQKTDNIDMSGPNTNWGTINLNPPPVPGTPSVSGPSTGVIDTSYDFDATSTDPSSIDIKYGWDWEGDGTVDEWSGWMSSGSTDTRSHQFSSADVYTIKVKTQNKGSQESSWGSHTITITSQPPNTPSAPSGPTSGDHNTGYTYTTSTTDPESDQVYYWFDWDDGTNSGWVGPYASGATGSASHTWTAPGTYAIKVKAKDAGNSESGWSPTTTVNMANTAPPVPNTPSGETSGHHGTAYTYTTNAVTDPEGDSVEYWFDWDDGTNSGWVSSPSASHTWDDVDTFSVRVKSRDDWDESGWSSSLSVSMDNRVPDTPSAPSGPTDCKLDKSYQYTASTNDADGDSLQYFFDWGDGSNSGWGGNVISHTWDTEGAFEVKVKARDDWDESSWSPVLVVYVTETGPTADADGPYTGCIDEPVQFYGSATEGETPYTWFWDFGDGVGTSTDQNPTYAYSSAENYIISLTVTDHNGESDTDTTFAYIVDCNEPIANANGPYYGTIDEDVQFTGSVVGGTAPYTWHWDFGDDSTSNEQNPTHAYSSGDTFTVTLTVTDDGGNADDDTTSAIISAGEPDLDCDGSLSWTGVKPESTVTGSFTVENIGGPGTLLDWEITEYPDWGTWTFTPEEGNDLTPENGKVTVEVTIIAPKAVSVISSDFKKNKDFSGQVTIVNKDDPSDYDTIDVSLVTPVNQDPVDSLFLQFIQNLIHRFPLIEKVFSSLPAFCRLLNLG